MIDEKKTLQTLVERAIQEEKERKGIEVKGPATDVLISRNYFRGFELALQSSSRDQFHGLFDSQIVSEYIGPWGTKIPALEGAIAAVRLGLTSLTENDINRVSNSYKKIPRLEELEELENSGEYNSFTFGLEKRENPRYYKRNFAMDKNIL